MQQLLPNFNAEINCHLEKLFISDENPCTEAARYSIFSSGKRLRPNIVLDVLLSFEKPIELGLDAACSLEIIHTYSLIHDDLPCMDNDEMRRGKPTVHIAYGEEIAVLTGDYLLTYAFEVLAKADLPSTTSIELIKILTKNAGIKGMIGGQILDLDSSKKLEEMHRKKTGALFSAAFSFGAIIGGASIAEQKNLAHIGTKLGLAYQIIDDIQDFEKDMQNQKTTFSTTLEPEKAADTAREIFKEITTSIHRPLPFVENFIKSLALFCNPLVK